MRYATLGFLTLTMAAAAQAAETAPPVAVPAALAAKPFALSEVRLLESPFTKAVAANREYLLALDADRLLAPFLREAGLPSKAKPYGNWESGGLDGHTAGHYLAALANMVASGADTKDGEFKRRIGCMLDELERCQKANGDGYIGGVPRSRELWKQVAAGNVGEVGKRWVPWYNVHKTIAGLRDVCLETDNPKARELLTGLGDWCVKLVSGLSDEQMQRMLGFEHGGMNEVMADVYAITGDKKYLQTAERFNHRAVLDPLMRHEDRLTGLHANTQIPKVTGLERIAALTGNKEQDSGARFFWETVTGHRSVAFGGNSVAEHFNDPKNFKGMLEHREGPETCNTYNMLRLTEQLFALQPKAAYADYYERALYNHILGSINPETPGYVYFTPIRPGHYRVYSSPQECFWCCVGTGMENPGKYGAFIYSHADDGIYVNLFIPSEVTVAGGLALRQETRFPYESRTRLSLKLENPVTMTLHVRHPAWVAAGDFSVKVNGEPVKTDSTPASYAKIQRAWKNGDVVEVELPMRTTVERLPDESNWAAILRGPIVLASPEGTNNLAGLRVNDSRMGHVAQGPLIPLDQVPALLTSADDLPKHVVRDAAAGPLRFRLVDVVEPPVSGGLALTPFFSLHDQRYQMYWELATREEIATRKGRLASSERARAAREAGTLDSVAVGEQQPEVEHDFKGEGAETGIHEGRRWRHGQSLQYTLYTRGEKAAELEVTYWGGDAGRTFDILVDGTLIATEELKAQKPGQFFEKRYAIPSEVLAKAANGRVTVRFVAKVWLAGGIFDLRLMRPSLPAKSPAKL